MATAIPFDWLVNVASVCKATKLTILHAATMRRYLVQRLYDGHIDLDFSGVESMTPEFVAHSLGALYWYLPPADLRTILTPAGLSPSLYISLKKGLSLAWHDIEALRLEMGH
jgi:hypothetical protein